MCSIEWLRRQAVGWSLGEPAGLADTLGDLEFVQADPIRAPAPAQDLILRHRVRGYRVGDLDRAYPTLDIDEDILYAYGFVTPRLRRLLHPRLDPHDPTRRYRPEGLAADVLAFVRAHGVTHPREVHAEFGREPAVNGWGRPSSATTLVLDRLHFNGLLRVARREGGVRLYEPARPLGRPLPNERRLRGIVLRIARTLAPVAEASLREAIPPRISRAVGGPRGKQAVVRELLASGELASVEWDGVRYVWPADLAPRTDDAGDRVRLLAPFDPVVWDRRRFEHLWGWAYRFEAYTPPAKRRLGYYALPLLWRDAVIGWANAAAGPAGPEVDVGFVDARPRSRRFSAALDAEIARLGTFLTPRR